MMTTQLGVAARTLLLIALTLIFLSLDAGTTTAGGTIPMLEGPPNVPGGLASADGSGIGVGNRIQTGAEPASEAGPRVSPEGEWAYEVNMPDGAATGVLSIRRLEHDFAGTITIDGRPGAMDLEAIDLEDSRLGFAFEAPGMGRIAVHVCLDGETFYGTMALPDGGSFRMTGHLMFGPAPGP